MKNFVYNTPTKVYFGKGVCDDVGAQLSEFGPGKIIVVYGGGSAVRSGLLGKITSSLDRHGIAHAEIGGVEPNPKVGKVREVIALAKAENADFLLAVGGGSVIDTVKCAAFTIPTGLDPWDVIMGAKVDTKPLPLGTVLTISAAGSEMSNSMVISNPEICIKKGRGEEGVRPRVSFLDPENTFTVSKYQTGCGTVDIMMHTMERYYTIDDDSDLTDRIAEGLLTAVKSAGSVAAENPEDYEARATLMWASSVSHNGLTGCGKNLRGMAVHALEHGVSGVFDRVAHGAGLAVLFPAWAKYVMQYDVRRFAQLGSRVWGASMDLLHPERTAAEGIALMKNYFRSIGMPVSLAELDIHEEDFERIADVITAGGTTQVRSYIPLGKKEVMDILELAK